MGRNPLAVEAQLNKELKAKGFSVTTVIAKDWTAAVTGSTRSHEEKDLAIGIVRSNKHVKKVFDAIDTQEDINTLKNKLLGVVQSMLALKNAVIARFAVNKRLLEATDVPVIEKTYGIFVPEKYARFSISNDGTISTTIRNIAGKVNDKTLKLRPSPDLKVWRWVSDIDETYLPFRTGDEIKEVAPSPSPPAPQRPVVNILKRLRPPEPVPHTTPEAVPPPSPRPSTPPPPPVSVDSAKLEGDINRSLRNAGIKGVTAEVRDDMAAVLKGTAVSSSEKQKAFEIARGFKGVREVRDIVFVLER